MKVFLRQFEKTDLPEVLRIERLSFALKPRSTSWFQHRLQGQPEGFIVAEINEKVAGYVVGRINDKNGKIIRVAIGPKYRREGVSHQLVAHILNYFKQKKVKQVQTEVRVSNQASIKFFQSFHFEVIKTLKKHYFDKEDAYLMKLTF